MLLLTSSNSSDDIWSACFKSFFKDLPFLKVLYWLPVRWKCEINPTVLGTFPRVCQIMCLHYQQKIRVTLWIVLYWPVLLSSKEQFWSWSVLFVSPQVKVLELESQLDNERMRLGELRKKHYEIAGVPLEPLSEGNGDTSTTANSATRSPKPSNKPAVMKKPALAQKPTIAPKVVVRKCLVCHM